MEDDDESTDFPVEEKTSSNRSNEENDESEEETSITPFFLSTCIYFGMWFGESSNHRMIYPPTHGHVHHDSDPE